MWQQQQKNKKEKQLYSQKKQKIYKSNKLMWESVSCSEGKVSYFWSPHYYTKRDDVKGVPHVNHPVRVDRTVIAVWLTWEHNCLTQSHLVGPRTKPQLGSLLSPHPGKGWTILCLWERYKKMGKNNSSTFRKYHFLSVQEKKSSLPIRWNMELDPYLSVSHGEIFFLWPKEGQFLCH